MSLASFEDWERVMWPEIGSGVKYSGGLMRVVFFSFLKRQTLSSSSEIGI